MDPNVVQANLFDGEHFRRCVSCDGPTTSHNLTRDGAEESYDNVLIMDLRGGYGLFFDNLAGDYTLVLCHECAHDACRRLPWLEKLLRPELSHAHREQHHRDHPDHWGWDYARRAGVLHELVKPDLFPAPQHQCVHCGHDEAVHEPVVNETRWQCKDSACNDVCVSEQ